MSTVAPETACAIVIVAASSVEIKVKLPTVDAFTVIAEALSNTVRVPVVLALKVAAAVFTARVTGEPAKLNEVVLAVLLTLTLPVVLAVRLVTLLVSRKVAALPATVTESVLAALLT